MVSYPLGQTGYRTQSLRESTLDPQLGPYIKSEPTSRSATPNMPYHVPAAYNAGSMARSYALPSMDSPNTPYPMGSQRRMPSILDSVNTPSSSDDDYYEPTPRGSKASKRTSKRQLSVSTNASISNYPLSKGKNKNRKIAIDLPWEPIPATIRDPNSKVDNVMIFDIQNAEGRKNRNQKKSVEVMSTLVHNSSVSAPDEVVFKHGIERTTRIITGLPNSEGDRISGESSPEPEVTQPAKKGGRRSKAALTTQNVNTGMTLRRDSHQSTFNPHKPYYTCSSDIDNEATYGSIPRRHHSGIRIHRDNTGPAITFGGTPLMSSSHIPGQLSSHIPPMSVLTSGLSQLAPHGSYQQRASASLQQSFSFGNDTILPSNMRTSNNGTSYAAMSYQPTNFGSFGQLNNISMTGTFGGNGNPLYGRGSPTIASGILQQQPQFGFIGASNLHSASVPDMSGIDPFSFGNLPLSPSGSKFDLNSVSGVANSLLFGDNTPAAEDDGATVSAPNSEG